MIVQIVENGVVVNAIVLPDGATIASGGAAATLPDGGSYPAPVDATLMSQTGAAIGWGLSGGVLAPPVVTAPAATMAQLRAYANAKLQALLAIARPYTLASGVSVLCDANSDTMIGLDRLASWGAANPTATMAWTDNFATVTTISGAEVVALDAAVPAYWQSVYAELAIVMSAIAAATMTTTAEIEASAWPT